jgi:hypothetical protein
LQGLEMGAEMEMLLQRAREWRPPFAVVPDEKNTEKEEKGERTTQQQPFLLKVAPVLAKQYDTPLPRAVLTAPDASTPTSSLES